MQRLQVLCKHLVNFVSGPHSLCHKNNTPSPCVWQFFLYTQPHLLLNPINPGGPHHGLKLRCRNLRPAPFSPLTPFRQLQTCLEVTRVPTSNSCPARSLMAAALTPIRKFQPPALGTPQRPQTNAKFNFHCCRYFYSAHKLPRQLHSRYCFLKAAPWPFISANSRKRPTSPNFSVHQWPRLCQH